MYEAAYDYFTTFHDAIEILFVYMIPKIFRLFSENVANYRKRQKTI